MWLFIMCKVVTRFCGASRSKNGIKTKISELTCMFAGCSDVVKYGPRRRSTTEQWPWRITDAKG